MITLPLSFPSLRRLFSRPARQTERRSDDRAEERRYVTYAQAEQRRLEAHLDALGEQDAAQRELLRALLTYLWSYRSSVRVGLLTCDQAATQYRLRVTLMGREFDRLRLPDPAETYLPNAAAFQALPGA